MSRLKLHQWEVSPFCNKVRRMLALKGLPYETVNYHGALRSLKAGKITGAGFLPVLDVDGELIGDSTAIAHWLDREYPDEPALYPADPLLRAQASLWEDWADEAFHWFEIYLRFDYAEVVPEVARLLNQGGAAWEAAVLGLLAPLTYRRRMRGQGIGRWPRGVVLERFFGHMDMLETVLSRQDWLVGSSRSIADIAVAGQLDEIRRTTIERKVLDYPATMVWLDRA